MIEDELVAAIDEEAKNFMELCDGKRSILEIRKIIGSTKNTQKPSKSVSDILNVCNILESKGVMKKKQSSSEYHLTKN
ncbi:hypothetical protein D3C81_1464030 [compost metagenome]